MAGLADTAAELEALAFRLCRVGDGELIREVTKAMRNAVVPVQNEIRAGLAPLLPNRYAATLDADLRLGVNVRTNERDPGVSVTGQSRTKARKLRNLDEGRLTHPVFGNGRSGAPRRSRRCSRAGSPARPRRAARGSVRPSSGRWRTSPTRQSREAE